MISTKIVSDSEFAVCDKCTFRYQGPGCGSCKEPKYVTVTPPDVFKDVKKERENQEIKWGEQNHKPLVWNAILGEEVGEVSKAILEGDMIGYRAELIQVAAVAIAAIESLDRQEFKEKHNL